MSKLHTATDAEAETLQRVLVRTNSAGVHIGLLLSRNGMEVTLRDDQIVYRWRGANTLRELANHGSDMGAFTRISEPTHEVVLTQAIEIISVIDDAVWENLTTARWL